MAAGDASAAAQLGQAAGYNVVYWIEIWLLVATLVALAPLLRRARRPQSS